MTLTTIGYGDITPVSPAARALATLEAKPLAEVKAALGNIQILDARSPSRFTGEEKEPRPGVRSGHMPGAANVHFRSLITAGGTLLRSAVS